MSARSPREHESLTVTTAAVSKATPASIVEENVIFLFPLAGSARHRSAAARTCAARTCAARAGAPIFCGLPAAIALRFVEQPQALHQQALRVELRGFLIGLALEVQLEVAARPAQNFEDGFIAAQSSARGVLHLAFDKEDL